MNDPSKKLLTIQQVADESGFSTSKIYALLAPAGDLACVRIALTPTAKRRTRGAIRIKRADWDAWVRRHRQVPAAEVARSSSIRHLPGADRYVQ